VNNQKLVKTKHKNNIYESVGLFSTEKG